MNQETAERMANLFFNQSKIVCLIAIEMQINMSMYYHEEYLKPNEEPKDYQIKIN